MGFRKPILRPAIVPKLLKRGKAVGRAGSVLVIIVTRVLVAVPDPIVAIGSVIVVTIAPPAPVVSPPPAVMSRPVAVMSRPVAVVSTSAPAAFNRNDIGHRR